MIPPVAPFRHFVSKWSREETLAELGTALDQLRCLQGWDVFHSPDGITLISAVSGSLELKVAAGPQESRSVLAHLSPPIATTEVLLVTQLRETSCAISALVRNVEEIISNVCAAYTPAEEDAIVASMPLLREFAPGPDSILSRFALVFRDHFVEDNLAFLLACARAGIEPGWTWSLPREIRRSDGIGYPRPSDARVSGWESLTTQCIKTNGWRASRYPWHVKRSRASRGKPGRRASGFS